MPEFLNVSIRYLVFYLAGFSFVMSVFGLGVFMCLLGSYMLLCSIVS